MTMPNFLIIGTQKAGTTSLYHYLNQHPEVYMSPVKEPNFFAIEGEKLNFRGSFGEDNLNSTPFANFKAYKSLFKGVENERAIGEASTLYLYSPKAPERIKYYIPDVKLIAILRNPVDRAFSNFLYNVRDGREPIQDFAQALQEEQKRILNNWGYIWHYRQRGFYCAQLKRYYDMFGRDQIKIILYEDLNNNLANVLVDIFKFIEVDFEFKPDITKKYNISNIDQNVIEVALRAFLIRPNLIKSLIKPLVPTILRRRIVMNILNGPHGKESNKPQLSIELRKQLIKFYHEDILKLQDLIQRDLSSWLYP